MKALTGVPEQHVITYHNVIMYVRLKKLSHCQLRSSLVSNIGRCVSKMWGHKSWIP